MTHKEKMQKDSEQFVRDVLSKLNEKADDKVVKRAAKKVVRAIPESVRTVANQAA